MANFPYRRHSRRRRELWRNKTGWVVRGVKCSKIFRRCSIDISPYRHARRKLISFERNWSWWWNVACYSLRVSRATALRCSRYADIRMSLFLFLFPSLSRRIFRSSSSTSIHSGEYYVWATSMDTCNSLVLVRTYPLKLLCAPWFNTRRHCLRLPCLFNLDELSSLVTDQMDFPFWFCVVLLLKRWMYCFFFFLFYFIFLRFIFSNIFGDIFRSKDRRLIESCRRTWKALWIGGILCRFVNGSLSRREKRTPSTNPDTIAWLSCITLLHRCRFRRPFI